MPLILVVDDVAAMAELYSKDLERLPGYSTLTASSGESALELLQKEPVDCVILDLEMPGMDGLDLLGVLRDRGDRTPVIVYTGRETYERCAQAVTLGAFGFIDKTEPMDRIVREVENALEQSRLMVRVEDLERLLRKSSRSIDRQDVPSESHGGARSDAGRKDEIGAPRTFRELKRRAERRILETALEGNDWHITRTAKELGLADHASLLKIMRRHALKRP